MDSRRDLRYLQRGAAKVSAKVSATIANRWAIAIVGTVVMMTIGCIYSWAIFSQPSLVAYHWDLRNTTWAYAIANFALAAAGALIGGFWHDKAGPRKVALVGVVLWGSGNVLAGVGTSAFGALWLYATYGIIGGVGARWSHFIGIGRRGPDWSPRHRSSQEFDRLVRWDAAVHGADAFGLCGDTTLYCSA